MSLRIDDSEDADSDRVDDLLPDRPLETDLGPDQRPSDVDVQAERPPDDTGSDAPTD